MLWCGFFLNSYFAGPQRIEILPTAPTIDLCKNDPFPASKFWKSNIGTNKTRVAWVRHEVRSPTYQLKPNQSRAAPTMNGIYSLRHINAEERIKYNPVDLFQSWVFTMQALKKP